MQILHITPHLGGGVGRVLLNYLSKIKDDHRFFHQIACLDYANAIALAEAIKIGLTLSDKMAGLRRQLLKMIAAADIVLIHWWNHPLLYDFLVRSKLPPCRVVMWSHISGFHPPYIFTEKILHYPDLFVFTTPASFEAKEVTEDLKHKFRVIWSTSGAEQAKNIKPIAHAGFNVGYIGTVDYCKMHPDFLDICSQVDIPDAHFIVCGGPKEKEIQLEAERIGVAGKFDFTGQVVDITKYLSVFDVFGYPLAPYHYGTCDQALAESMACGIVPVVFSNKMENQMVKDGVTGMIVNNKEEYGNAIKKLYTDRGLKTTLSNNAKAYARRVFTLEVLKKEWEAVFEEMMRFPKIERKWEITAKDVFLESLGAYSQEFLNTMKELSGSPAWQARTRGTVHHYHDFFPEDKQLALWSKLMEGADVLKQVSQRGN